MNRAVSSIQYDFFDLSREAGDAPRRDGGAGPEPPGPTPQWAPGPGFERFYDARFDPDHGVLWAWLRADAPARFTPALVAALRDGQRAVETRVRREMATRHPGRLRYQVLGSRVPGVFSLGGDLELISRLVRAGDGAALRRYAYACVDLVHKNAVGYRLPVTTISLVQGQALGGGFEAALAAHVVVAERDAKMGLPEVLFNLFPGMGAYQLLSRRLPPARAEALILGGRTHSAEELHELGVIDVLAEPGEGEQAVRDLVRSTHRQLRGRQGLRAAVEASSPLELDALNRAADIWVDCALALGPRDLEVIDYLVRAQARLRGGVAPCAETPAQGATMSINPS